MPPVARLDVGSRPARRRFAVLLAASLLGLASSLSAQTTGSIVGRLVDAVSQEPLAGAEVRIEPLGRNAASDEDGRFVFAGVPTGIYTLHIELLSYQSLTVERVTVRAGRRSDLSFALSAAAIPVEPLVVEAERVPLIEPEVSETHHVLRGRELREVPADNVDAAVELVTGVADGHFRGGRTGQEVYVVDGLALKNQLEASSQGFGLELAPSALAEIDVTTGGFGAEYGSALSGVVSLVTRKGDPDRWRGRARLLSDHWMPDDLSAGFSELSLSAGGPLPLIGKGSTLFADLFLQGMLDADPRANGLTCLRPEQAEPELAAAIMELRNDPATSHLYCPYSNTALPHQQGDKLIGFVRLDRPAGRAGNLTATLLRNRFQRQLYTSEFKYNPLYQLGQRLEGTLGSLTFDWARQSEGKSLHLTARGAGMRLDRYLGVVDPEALADRASLAGFGFGDFRFLGEDFVRKPIDEQDALGNSVPGYRAAGSSAESPFGIAAEGLFFTEGTPTLANWTRSTTWAGDLVGEMITASGSSLRAGGSARFYTVENYERPFAYAADSLVNFNRYHPTTLSGFAELRLPSAELFAATFGVRVETFRSGLSFDPDTSAAAGPVIDPSWKLAVVPRIGFAGAFRNTAGQTSFHFNFARLAQPPDFRFFVDTTIGDSLRTDIRRQGNPDLAFETGRAFELGVRHLVANVIGLSITAYRKEYRNLVSGSLQSAGGPPGLFTTGDKGTTQGVEVTALGRWPALQLRAGYALQQAKGLTSGALDEDVDPEAQVQEFPLAHDRRHSLDLIVLAGRANGYFETGWGASLAASVRSGYPLDRFEENVTRLPWTAFVAVRVSRELGRLPLCETCRARVILDGRNILGRDNVIALRRDTGGLGPPPEQVLGAGNDVPQLSPIPRESRDYNALIDLDSNGSITTEELRLAREAAVLDRNDPSLYFGPARQLRIGVEVEF